MLSDSKALKLGDVDEPDAADHFEVTTVVRTKSEVVPQGRRADQQIEIADRSSLPPEVSAFAAENVAHLVVDGQNRHASDELQQYAAAPFGVPRVMHPLIEFGKRDHAERESVRAEVLQALRDGCNPVEVIDHPIGVE